MGARGWGNLTKSEINNIDNLLLACHDCHVLIAADKSGPKYSGELLLKWKKEHVERIIIVIGISPGKKSHAIFYGANIGNQISRLQKTDAYTAMFSQNRYPTQENSIQLSMKCSHNDGDPEYWKTESDHLKHMF